MDSHANRVIAMVLTSLLSVCTMLFLQMLYNFHPAQMIAISLLVGTFAGTILDYSFESSNFSNKPPKKHNE